MENVLVLVRHGQSEWNARNLFTGWKDVGLTETGRQEARKGGDRLKTEGITFDIAYTSALQRAQKTLEIILDAMGQQGVETVRDQALNERDYGDLVGLDKAETAKKYGDEQVHIWRRSYDTPPPGGESLKDTAARVLPYYEARILPDVLAGKNVIVSAHGNSLRALIMRLEGLSGAEIVKREIPTGVPVIYRLNADGSVAEKRDLSTLGA